MRKKLLLVLFVFIFSFVFSAVYVENDEVVFTFKYEEADIVYLSGTFNDWAPADITMEKENGIWIVRLKLEPGYYEYKYVVNGEKWIEDPEAPAFVDDGFGGKNGAFVLVKVKGKLEIHAPQDELQQEESSTEISYPLYI